MDFLAIMSGRWRKLRALKIQIELATLQSDY